MYLAVTSDKYELPIAVAGTARELAKMLGVSANSISSSIYRVYKGKKTKIKYLVIDENEGE